MTAKLEKDKAKQLQDKCQSVLNSLLRDEDNKYCVDCDSKGEGFFFVVSKTWFTKIFVCRSSMGIMEFGGVFVHPLRWYPQESRRAHL